MPRSRPPFDLSELAELTVTDTGGQPVRVGGLWAEQPSVVVWLRHYG